ncbi:MAG: tetratricopeptide repeat protein [Gammaproteobacteria bacterium]|nr:tetratricopeptide repeat protein [Gammaproteobacteria bacterium]
MLANHCLRVSLENQSQYWIAAAEVYHGAATEDASQLRRGSDAHKATGAQLARSVHLQLLADIYIHQGQMPEARVILDEALSFTAGGETVVLAELYRLQGELTLAEGGSLSVAIASFERAIEIARQQQAKSFELRAVMSLALVWERQGRIAEARERLATVYSWFTEGFDTPDLQEARALLLRLA